MPPGLIADTVEGNSFVSLVSFEFNDIRIMRFRVPFHVNFPEINLRFYVRDNERRGVVFVREHVPKTLVALIANAVYNENYKKARMFGKINRSTNKISVEHQIYLDGSAFHVRVTADVKPFIPGENSAEHFFKEQKWGFGKSRSGKLLAYAAEHPCWAVYPITGYLQNFDFGQLYGKQWEFLNSESPFNVMLAQGSLVQVFSPEKN